MKVHKILFLNLLLSLGSTINGQLRGNVHLKERNSDDFNLAIETQGDHAQNYAGAASNLNGHVEKSIKNGKTGKSYGLEDGDTANYSEEVVTVESQSDLAIESQSQVKYTKSGKEEYINELITKYGSNSPNLIKSGKAKQPKQPKKEEGTQQAGGSNSSPPANQQPTQDASPPDEGTQQAGESTSSPPVTLDACNLDPTVRRENIIATLFPMVTPMTEFEDTKSAARQAFEWLVESDEFYICPEDPQLVQRYIVGKIYFQMNGDGWTDCDSNGDMCEASYDILNGTKWLEPVHECEWAFLLCGGGPTQLDIIMILNDENNVTGTLLNEIDELEYLFMFKMDDNEIRGTIPTQFGNLSLLEVLDLGSNRLTGVIPDEIFMNTNLAQLDLDSNKLTGTISTQLKSLWKLSYLQLAGNKITGTFPQELSQLTNLAAIDLSDMMLTGAVTQEICDQLAGPILQYLAVDCGVDGDGNGPKVTCDCCIVCP
mmetsp:Transcript_3401/g.6207  ORF Transcript_3401/g.6207 Transcript_3401/m.6207 type:complete len:485 (-) Transcript_3401:153-1607(-)